MSQEIFQPHPWLTLPFSEVLALLKSAELPIKIRLTRPSEHSYGEGALRVLQVRTEPAATHLVLAYERYRSRPRTRRAGNSE